MPPKRKAIANVDKEPKSKKLKLMSDTKKSTQTKLVLVHNNFKDKDEVYPDRHINNSNVDPLIRPGHKLWYFALDPEAIVNTRGWSESSDRPCPELPKDMWFEILKKVLAIWYRKSEYDLFKPNWPVALMATCRYFNEAIKPHTEMQMWYNYGGVSGNVFQPAYRREMSN